MTHRNDADDDVDEECSHDGVEEIREERDGYYRLDLVCVGCGRVVDHTDWQKLWDPDEEE